MKGLNLNELLCKFNIICTYTYTHKPQQQHAFKKPYHLKQHVAMVFSCIVQKLHSRLIILI